MPKEKSIEERYQKKTPIEHILLRPDTYVGSNEHHQQQMWVYDATKDKMVYRNIDYVPGIYKIFDEILVNAADNVQRTDRMKMTAIRVNIDAAKNTISVWNDGRGIPVEIHREHQMYVPELIFGHLLTSDNYDDTEKRVTGGRNGYGAKLTNVFSTEFTVECLDAKNGRRFKMTWTDNMTKHSEPEIEDTDEEKDFVLVTYKPDLKKFNMTKLDDDVLSLMTKRVWDVAGVHAGNLKVYLNKTKLKCSSFQEYVDKYIPEKQAELPKIHEKGPRWEVVVTLSEGSFGQVSFVNSIATIKGGTHVAYVVDQLCTAISKKVSQKNKNGVEVKNMHIKNHLWVFINCLIENPAFDSQIKETLTTKPAKFGSTFTISDKALKQVCNSGIVDNVLLWAEGKKTLDLQRKMKTGGTKGQKQLTGIPKLEDANDAGGRYAEQCTLIITEGDSAKTSCIAGLSVVGRDRYGVFPLRGKMLNVRECKNNQVTANQELTNLLKVMGLQIGKRQETPKGLRYGSIMIMTDQDTDGSHIKGLLINLFDHYWPELLQYRGFLKEFVTPIVKVTRSSDEVSFFTLPEYEQWKEENNDGKGWKTKYYKGLGTSTDREFKEYFKQIDEHQLTFKWTGGEDSELIDMAFSKKKADERKEWILKYEDGTFVDHSKSVLTYTDFINKELVIHSKYDTARSIASLVDGWKPGQRKVLFAVLKKKVKTDLKVAQLAGYVAEHSAYHHGEASLQTTIINMAQNFVGSNNINILVPSGQFGSRKEGGKDSSAPRYIFTRLSLCAQHIFHPDDLPLLDHQKDDGMIIEPKFYVPVIPMVLVNGCDGIGTGWSSSVQNYNPRDIIANIRRFLRGEEMEPMAPWYRGFQGQMKKNSKGGYDSIGTINKIDDTTVEITELPVKKWTQDYKEWLEKQLPQDDSNGKGKKDKDKGADKGDSHMIEEYRDNSGHAEVHFTVRLTEEKMAECEKKGLATAFKLKTSLALTNMTLFGPDGKIHKYESELDILTKFNRLRLEFYKKRKAYLVDKLERELRILSNKVKFVLAVVNEELEIRNRKRQLLLDELQNLGFDAMSAILEGAHKGPEGDVPDPDQVDKEDESVEDGDEGMGVVKAKDYDYLLGMAMWNLTQEKVEELRKQKGDKETELDTLRRTTEHQLWEKDLDALEVALAEQDRIDAEDAAAELDGKKGKRKKVIFSPPKGKVAKGRIPAANKAKAKAKAAKAKKKKDNDLMDDSSDDDDDDDDDMDDDMDESDYEEDQQQQKKKAKEKKGEDKDKDKDRVKKDDKPKAAKPKPKGKAKAKQDGGKDKKKESSEEGDAPMEVIDADADDDDHDDDMGRGAGAAAGGGKAAKAKVKAKAKPKKKDGDDGLRGELNKQGNLWERLERAKKLATPPGQKRIPDNHDEVVAAAAAAGAGGGDGDGDVALVDEDEKDGLGGEREGEGRPVRKGRLKKKVQSDHDDDDDDEEDEDEDEESEEDDDDDYEDEKPKKLKAAKAKPKAKQAAKRPADDDDDDDDDDEDEDEDGAAAAAAAKGKAKAKAKGKGKKEQDKKDKGKSLFDDDLFADDEDDKKAPKAAAAKPKKAADKEKPAAAAAAAAAVVGKKKKREDDDDDESSDTPKKKQPKQAKAKNPPPKKPPKQRSEDDEDEDDRMEDVEDEESEEVRRPRRAAAQATGGGKKKYVKSDDDEDDEEEEDDNGDDDFEG